jgi:hypothetical protein
MDTSDVYPDVLGDALSYSSQRLAQLASLVTAAATVEARRRAQANAARAARDEQALSVLRDQERAAWQLARAGWAPAHDSRWLAQADLLQAARVWSAAAAYADADPTAGSAARKCEERLRALHPYAMAWYDRLRSEGSAAFDAMRQALPLFARAPHTRPGDPAAQRRALESDAAPLEGGVDGSVRLPDAGHGLDLDVEKRGYRIAERLQARALAERGYMLSSDELATTLGATTTLPGEVIARLARAASEDRVAAGAERGRAVGLDRASYGLLVHHDSVSGEHLVTASQDKLVAGTASGQASAGRTAAQLAAESFPCSAADAVRAAAQVKPSPIQKTAVQDVRQLGRSV